MTTENQAPEGADERAAFEAWGFAQGLQARNDDRGMNYPLGEQLWKAWQARAALAAQRPASPLDGMEIVIDDTIPPDELHVVQDGKVTHVVKVDAPAPAPAEGDVRARAQALVDHLWGTKLVGIPFHLVADLKQALNAQPQPKGVPGWNPALTPPDEWAGRLFDGFSQLIGNAKARGDFNGGALEKSMRDSFAGLYRALTAELEKRAAQAPAPAYELPEGFVPVVLDEARLLAERLREEDWRLGAAIVDALCDEVQAARDTRAFAVAQSPATLDVLAERQRQIEHEGYTRQFDADMHDSNDLARAAAFYAMAEVGYEYGRVAWPWDEEGCKVKDRYRNFTRAAALLIAAADVERARSGDSLVPVQPLASQQDGEN